MQILKQENTHVVATARSPDKAGELKDLQDKHKDRLQLIKLDLADESSIKVGNSVVNQPRKGSAVTTSCIPTPGERDSVR